MTHTTPIAPAQRTPRHAVPREARITWLPEAAIAAGAVIAASGAVLPTYALPCAAAGLIVVAGALTARIRGLRATADEPAVPELREPMSGTELRIRLRAHLRDITLAAGLPDHTLRVYRRTADGFVRIDGDEAVSPEAVGDQHVLTAAWLNGIAKLPRREDDRTLTVVATRINDRHSNRPIAVVVIAPESETAGDEAIRRARTSDGWARLATFLETATMALAPLPASEPVRVG